MDRNDASIPTAEMNLAFKMSNEKLQEISKQQKSRTAYFNILNIYLTPYNWKIILSQKKKKHFRYVSQKIPCGR